MDFSFQSLFSFFLSLLCYFNFLLLIDLRKLDIIFHWYWAEVYYQKNQKHNQPILLPKLDGIQASSLWRMGRNLPRSLVIASNFWMKVISPHEVSLHRFVKKWVTKDFTQSKVTAYEAYVHQWNEINWFHWKS